MRITVAAALIAIGAALALPGIASAAVGAGQPFPTDLHTLNDRTQATGLRVNLPKPDCAVRPSDCADVNVLNELDGFNIQPRISIPFSGPIDISTVSSSTVFLVGPAGRLIGINQIVWEPAANTLHIESDEQLEEATTYLLVVTRGIRGSDGARLRAMSFPRDSDDDDDEDDDRGDDYWEDLSEGLHMAKAGGVKRKDVAAASLFTTQSVRATSRKIRRQLRGAEPNFVLGTGGERTVFPLATVSSITWRRQISTTPAFSTGALVLPLLAGVGTVAFGTYESPDYENAAKVIPAVGTRTGSPRPQGTNHVQFSLFLPAGTRPADGWPVAIFGHGFGDWKNGAPPVLAGALARAGIATVAINVVGHGGGSLGTYTINRGVLPPVTLALGGRGIDQDGNTTIDSTEGVNAVSPYGLVGTRDGLRQTTIDLMQLVKVLRRGVDVDADGADDVSTRRIYYAGQSFGGIYGAPLLGLERRIRAGVLNVPGGPIIEIARLSPNFRILVGLSLLTRIPSLYNAIPNAGLNNFHENIPLRGLPPVTATPDETAIQQFIDRSEWAQQSANPAAYAPYVRAPVIYQFARGDQTVPNPTTSAILRACGCADRATLFRNDLAFALNPLLPKNPHQFLTNVGVPAAAPFAFAAQLQLTTFLGSDGATTIDPDVAGPLFETPTSMVPEDLAYIP